MPVALPPDDHVYDKAKYHYDGNFPDGLPHKQAFVHTGLFLGWLADHHLLSEEMEEDGEEELERFRRRQITGPELFEYWDGALVADMLTEEGNAFAYEYFEFKHGTYLEDYDQLLSADLPTMYHVQDTWENYERLRQRIDQRYREWKQSQQPAKPWWRFW